MIFFSQDEIYSSASVAVYYIKHLAKLEGKVYVMGCPGLVEELEKEHIPHIGFGVSNLFERSYCLCFSKVLSHEALHSNYWISPGRCTHSVMLQLYF